MSKGFKYNFAFVATTLRLNDFRRVVELLRQNPESGINELIENFSSRKAKTNKRVLYEYIKRYECLTPAQIDLFLKVGAYEQAQISFLSCCKAYSYLADFVVEVVREKFLVFDTELTEADYRSFVNSKSDFHNEINELAETTLKKVKQHVFKMIEEGGLIDSVKTRIIQPQYLSNDLKNVIIRDNPEWLKLFLFSDYDIELEINDDKRKYRSKI